MKTIKNIACLVLMIVSSEMIFSQYKNKISFGAGVLNTSGMGLYFAYSTNKDFKTNSSAPLHLKFERVVSDHWSAGVSLSYASVRGTWNGYNSGAYFDFSMADPHGGNYTLKSYSFVARFNCILSEGEFFELYVGGGVGYKYNEVLLNHYVLNERTYNYEYVTERDNASFPISVELSLGMRCYVLPEFGFYGEVGAAKSIFQAGIFTCF